MKYLNPSDFFLFVFIGFIFIINSCGKGETADPPDNPSPTNYTHTITINSNVDGAIAKVWDGGSLKKSGTTNVSGQVILAPINQEVTTNYDSVTLDKAGYIRWKVINQSVAASKTYNVTLEEIAQAYKASIAGNTNADDIEGWKDNIKVLTSSGNGPYNTNEVEFTAETLTLDSLLYKGAKMETLKETDVVLQPGTNNKDVTLDPSGSIVSGTITNIENSLGLSDAYIVAWDGDGSMIYVETDANGHFEIPVDIDINEIRIIKEGYQTRTIYEKTDQATTMDRDIFDKATFPIEFMVECMSGQPNVEAWPGSVMHFVNTPTVYILKDTVNYPASAYESVIEKLISDTDEMSLGNTSKLNIEYIANESELPTLSDDNPLIYIKFVTGQNSTFSITKSNDNKHIRYGTINVNFIDEDQAYSSFSEEWGSLILGARYPPDNSQIVSNYSSNITGFGASFYQVVDTLLSKFHWSRKNETATRTDTESTPEGFNKIR